MADRPRYDSYTHGDSFGPKRWTHQRRFVDAQKFLQLQPDDRLLDYGCGDGYFLERCRDHAPAVHITGYDPMATMAAQARERLGPSVKITERLDQLPAGQFNKIVCLETCEHLVPSALEETLQHIARLLSTDGLAIFSVPVEIGPVSLVKNAFRLIRRKNYENMKLKNVWSAAFGIAPTQFINYNLGYPYIFSHIGFDHRRFARILRQHFQITKIVCSPFPLLGTWFNPTVYFLCRHTNE